MARSQPRRHHRRRRHRRVDRLPSGQCRRARRAGAGEGAAHPRLDVARGRARRTAALEKEPDPAHAELGRRVRPARGRDRASDRLAQIGIAARRLERGAHDRDPPLPDPGARLRLRSLRDLAQGGAGPFPLDVARRHRRRRLDSFRRLHRSLFADHGVCQRRPRRWRKVPRRRPRHRFRDRRAPGAAAS